MTRILFSLVVIACASTAKGQEQQNTCSPGWISTLSNTSTYQNGCWPPCMCPLQISAPLQGTMRLVESASDAASRTFLVEDVQWRALVGNTTLKITGKGWYRLFDAGTASPVPMHQMELDLTVGEQPVEHFDSGLIAGGTDFPRIRLKLSVNGEYCLDTVLTIDTMVDVSSGPVPRHAPFVVAPAFSEAAFTLFVGTQTSPVAGALQLFLGDPGVPVIALAGMTGLSVEKADLVAVELTPAWPIASPLRMRLDPRLRSIGSWNRLTGQVDFELHLIGVDRPLPVPQPLHLRGTLMGGKLAVGGDNGPIADALMTLKLLACERPLSPAPEVWFSTQAGFTAGRLITASFTEPHTVSAGDLLSSHGYIVRTNAQLMSRFALMPPAPDVGLDAVTAGPQGHIWFSFTEQAGQIWSESLGRYLAHGDLLSDAGQVIQTNEQLLARFGRMPPVSDAGLDALAIAPTRELLFSTEVDFLSEALGVTVRRGDLLSNRGRIVRTNAQLLSAFKPQNATMGPAVADYGLDVVILRGNAEIWFSVETGFLDATLGPIGDGDLLSTEGRIVRRNRELVGPFAPLEDLGDFGLDAAALVYPTRTADFDFDGTVDDSDLEAFRQAVGGPTLPSPRPEVGDLDGDGDSDQDDFGVLQRCLGGSPFASADCDG